MKKLYIVMWQDGTLSVTSPMIGHLPLERIPKGSVLRKALFSEDECLQLEGGYGGALRGVYEKRALAVAHMQAEKAWRGDDVVFWIETIKSRSNVRKRPTAARR
jgi:hypothetical protein